jgi:AcrR family transcriptional regulator
MYAKSAATIANIIEAAERLFITRHYADVTMADIADAADVTKGALYHHFPSKEALYLTMMHNYLDETRKHLSVAVKNNGSSGTTGRAGSGASSRERLRRFTLLFLELPAERQALMRLVRRDINIFQGAERERLVRAYQAAVPELAEAIIRDGIVNGEIQEADARLLAWEHVALVEVVLRPYAQIVLGGPEKIAAFVTDLFFDGVAVKTRLSD